jgi:cell wall-associated NlpC family hydrolase
MQLLREVALSCLWSPYKWGGNNKIEGFDCSGLAQYLLKVEGLDPPGDQTAQGLYDHFEKNGSINCYSFGSLAFFGKDARNITHVAFCMDQHRMLEAGGGGPHVTNISEAVKANAFVRVRPIKSRNDLVAVIRPYYRDRAVA